MKGMMTYQLPTSTSFWGAGGLYSLRDKHWEKLAVGACLSADTLSWARTVLSGISVDDAEDTVTWAQHYLVKRNARTLFTADAGVDGTILTGDTITLTADDIGEDAIYYWLDSSGDTIASGMSIDVTPSSTTTYTLEVMAEADAFKDYDDVTVNVTNGLITSVAPNPASSTTTVYYETSGVSTVKLKVVEVGSMMQVDLYTVSAGVGNQAINVSGYNTGAHIITLEGDSENLDSETLIVE